MLTVGEIRLRHRDVASARERLLEDPALWSPRERRSLLKGVTGDDLGLVTRGVDDELKDKVGGERISFVFAEAKDLQKAKKLIKGDSQEIDEKQKRLSISNDKGVKKLKQLLEEFESEKIKVVGMSLSKPTLDDVFMNLTGHKATKAEANGHTKPKGGEQK